MKVGYRQFPAHIARVVERLFSVEYPAILVLRMSCKPNRDNLILKSEQTNEHAIIHSSVSRSSLGVKDHFKSICSFHVYPSPLYTPAYSPQPHQPKPYHLLSLPINPEQQKPPQSYLRSAEQQPTTNQSPDHLASSSPKPGLVALRSRFRTVINLMKVGYRMVLL